LYSGSESLKPPGLLILLRLCSTRSTNTGTLLLGDLIFGEVTVCDLTFSEMPIGEVSFSEMAFIDLTSSEITFGDITLAELLGHPNLSGERIINKIRHMPAVSGLIF
jgi:hypothetical protein